MDTRRRYAKPFLSISEQVDLLKSRGLEIGDEQAAARFLEHTNYYRFAGYVSWFESTPHPNHTLVQGIAFRDVRALYSFDEQLRPIVLAAVCPIETCVRTFVAYRLAEPHQVAGRECGGAFAHLGAANYRPGAKFGDTLAMLRESAWRSKDPRIRHLSGYVEFPDLPIWAAVELMTLGSLSLFYKQLIQDIRRPIARRLVVRSPKLLASWLHTLSQVRNQCAHQGRLWDYRYPAHLAIPVSWKPQPVAHSLFAALLVIHHLYRAVDPDAAAVWRDRVTQLVEGYLADCPMREEFSGVMGLMPGWQNHVGWLDER